jgi:hypothetical protein
MTPAVIRGTAVDLLIAGEIAGVGAVWVPVDDEGPRWPVIDDPIASWRQALIAGSAPIRVALERRLDEVMAGTGCVVELMPGVAAIGSVIPDREHPSNGVAILPTAELVNEGSLSMLCSAARLDETLIRSLAAEATLPPRGGLPSLSVLVRRLHRAAIDRMRERESQQSVDRRLA